MTRLLIALILLFSATALSPANAALVSRDDVRQAAAETAKQVESDYGLYNNASQQQRVQRIGNRLARRAKYQEGVVYAFQVLNMPEVNAFSLPDGHVYITRGLLDMVQRDDQLVAAVIGHEIGHIASLHVYHRVERAMEQEVAGNLFDAIFGSKLGKVGGYARAIANDVIFAEYSQDQEVKADEFGIVLADRAGFDATAMSDFLGMLARTEKKNGVLKYLQDHPSSAKRQEYADTFLQNYDAGKVEVKNYTSPSPPPEAFDFDYPSYRNSVTDRPLIFHR